MLEYKRLLYLEKLKKLFTETDAQSVLEWYIANEARYPVVLVGAGFTRNARMHDGYASNLPMWNNILDQFKEELGFDKHEDTHDALTLAELYQEQMKPDGLRNKIYKMFPDDDLEPGPAHDALADYPVEAVITTNAFDTVLDKGKCKGRFDPVIADIDLSKVNTRNPRIVQLLYIHGHRSCPNSWVFTRSQYEDIEKDKPRLITRVKQLIAQHPLLIVGYSLADPDFHHFYRDIALSMGGYHPLSLAVLTSEPSDAEKKHWEKLGVRIVIPKTDSSSFNKFFTAFFKISPTPETPFANFDDLPKLFDGKTFKDRLTLFRGISKDKEKSSIVRMSSKYELFQLWNLVGKKELTSDELAEIDVLTQEANSEFLDQVNTGRSAPLEKRTFNKLPGDLFSTTEKLPWVFDKLLSKKVDYHLLNEWILEILESDEQLNHRYFFGPINAVVLAAVISQFALEENSDDRWLKEQRKSVEQLCLHIISKYKLKESLPQSLDRFLDVSKDVDNEEFSYAHSGENYLAIMKNGYDFCMKGEWQKAWDCYRQAFDIANAKKQQWESWIAAKSALSVYSRLVGIFDESPAKTEVYVDELSKLERQEEVVEWYKERHRRELDVLKKRIDHYKKHEREQKWGISGFSFDNIYYSYWVLIRMLESRHASPIIISDYRKPLLDIPETNVIGELKDRLKYDDKDTGKWLAAEIEQLKNKNDIIPIETIEKIFSILLQSECSNVHLYAALKALGKITNYIPENYVEKAIQFVLATRTKLGYSIETFDSSCRLLREYGDALFPLLKYRDVKYSMKIIQRYLYEIKDHGNELFTWTWLSSLPWEEWTVSNPSTLDDWLKIIDGLNTGLSNDKDFRVALIESLIQILFETNEINLSKVNKNRILKICKDVFNAKTESYQWDVKITALEIVTKISVDLQDSSYSIDCFRQLQTEIQKMNCRIDERINFTAGIINACWKPLNEQVQLFELHNDFLQQVEKHHDEWIRFSSDNPGSMFYLHRFFSKTMQYEFSKKTHEIVRNAILKSLEVSPEHWQHYQECLSPEHWGTKWTNLVDLLKKHMSGKNKLKPFHFKVQSYNAISNKHEPTQELKRLFMQVLSDIDHSDLYVAHNAAFASIKLARVVYEKADIQKCSTALTKIADDSRMLVRMAAANACGWHCTDNQVSTFKAQCEKLCNKLKDDPYAMVQQQLRSGQIWGAK